MLRCVAVYCSVLQCATVLQRVNFNSVLLRCILNGVAVEIVLQRVAMRCSVLQCVAVCCSVCSVLQCVAVCCRVLQCVKLQQRALQLYA